MTLYVCPHNDIELKVESASIAITDIALTGSYSFKLNKKSEKWYYYHEMQGTHVNVGKKIKNMFSENAITELECVVYLNCNDGKKDYAIEYPTTLHLGTVRNY